MILFPERANYRIENQSSGCKDLGVKKTVFVWRDAFFACPISVMPHHGKTLLPDVLTGRNRETDI